jgi:hypothetical protein
MSNCEIVLVRSVDDAEGYLCGGKSIVECCDCGAKLCQLHADECDLCKEPYCSMCLFFHMDQPHAKPSEAARKKKDAPKRRIA